MGKIKLLWILGIFILIHGSCYSQFTRQQAIDFVLDSILVNELDNINLYFADELKSGQTGFSLADLSTISYPYDSNFVFFVDDNPFAGWKHSCRYIFINSESGENEVINADLFPEGWKTDFMTISHIPTNDSIVLTIFPENAPRQINPNPHLFAVIICGMDEGIFWNDVSAVYTTLVKYYGFLKDNIFVHYANGPNSNISRGNDLDGDQLDDIDYDAYKSTIATTFSGLVEGNSNLGIPKLTPEDALFVFGSDHGGISLGSSVIYLPNMDELSDGELASYVNEINCSQMIFLFAQCYSGGFIDELMTFDEFTKCKNRYVYTAAKDDELSHHERWITTCQNWPTGGFFEFVFYWTAAVRGYYPHPDAPWENSYKVGDFPFESHPSFNPPSPAKPHSKDWNPDTNISKGGNNDGIIQMREAFNYADSMDSWSPNEYFCLYPLNPPENLPENPQTSESDGNGGFEDNVVGFPGIIGLMNNTQEVEGDRNYLIGGEFIVAEAETLTIGSTANIYLHDNIYVDGGISLGEYDTVFHADTNSVQVFGEINMGTGVTFRGGTNTGRLGGLHLLNPDGQVVIDGAYFINTRLINFETPEFNVTGSAFNNCKSVTSLRGDVSFINSTFTDNSNLYFNNLGHEASSTAVVQYCSFSNSNLPALQINNYNNYIISANSIHNGSREGIALYFCGNGQTKTIANNYIFDLDRFGVMCYHSSGILNNNHIFDNQFGIGLLNGSTFKVFGNPVASFNDQTQGIYDNSSYEIFADINCFPYPFLYNIISDPDNLGNSHNPPDPLIYWKNPYLNLTVSVQNNCWGSNFNNEEDLRPYACMTGYDIVLCPPQGAITPPDPPDALFGSAEEEIAEESYSIAKEIFYSLIDQYPHTVAAQTALKLLFVQEYYAGNDYESLKEYYLANDSILADSSLKEIGEFMANECDIVLENWANSINWYENRIMNPNSMEDSIYAIIDLGYLYFLMVNDSLKSEATGALPQYKPENMETFIPYRDSLLRLLPGEPKEKRKPSRILTSKIGELLRNSPNPFATETEISFILTKPGTVSIIISDNLSRVVRTVELGYMESDSYKKSIKTHDLPPGMYFYSLYVNGCPTDTKKMMKL
jgi:hypothetical protein